MWRERLSILDSFASLTSSSDSDKDPAAPYREAANCGIPTPEGVSYLVRGHASRLASTRVAILGLRLKHAGVCIHRWSAGLSIRLAPSSSISQQAPLALEIAHLAEPRPRHLRNVQPQCPLLRKAPHGGRPQIGETESAAANRAHNRDARNQPLRRMPPSSQRGTRRKDRIHVNPFPSCTWGSLSYSRRVLMSEIEASILMARCMHIGNALIITRACHWSYGGRRNTRTAMIVKAASTYWQHARRYKFTKRDNNNASLTPNDASHHRQS